MLPYRPINKCASEQTDVFSGGRCNRRAEILALRDDARVCLDFLCCASSERLCTCYKDDTTAPAFLWCYDRTY
jgi:hypothetical protein